MDLIITILLLLWSLRIFPSLPGSRLTFFYRDASSALLQLVNQWLLHQNVIGVADREKQFEASCRSVTPLDPACSTLDFVAGGGGVGGIYLGC